MTRQYQFWLELTPKQLMQFYHGTVQSVLVRAHNGLKLQIDLQHFRPYILHSGLTGYFLLTTSDSGKFIALEKIN